MGVFRDRFVCRVGSQEENQGVLQFLGTAPPIGQPTDMFNDPYNSATPSNSFFGSLYTNTPGQGDVLSPFYNSENKNEDSINLGDRSVFFHMIIKRDFKGYPIELCESVISGFRRFL